jgi:predicted nucleic acid-binding protein
VILVDTSVWIDHLNKPDPQLMDKLNTDSVLMHPYVIGEIGLGSLRNRHQLLAALEALKQVVVASHEEVMRFIELYELAGAGIGYVDAHLLAATQLTPEAKFWTRDLRLSKVAQRLGLS